MSIDIATREARGRVRGTLSTAQVLPALAPAEPLPLTRPLRGQPLPTGEGWRPVVTVVAVGRVQRVAAVDRAAEASGLFPGMALADARALAPNLIAVPSASAEALQDLARLAGWCTRYTPWTAVEQADEGSGAGLWLDVSGCTHLFGGEAALLDDLCRRFAALGFTARAALADTPGAAWAWARFARSDAMIIAPGAQRTALADLPIAALRLGAATIDRLNSLGLRTIGALYRLPRAALATRFGDALLLRLDQALGLSEEPIAPHQPVAPCRAALAFAEPILTAEAIAAALDQLITDLCNQLTRQEKGARHLTLTAYRCDGTTASLAVGTNQPTRDPPHLARLFRERLERLDPAPGIDALALAAQVAPLAASQLGLAGDRTNAPDLTQLFDVLGLRLGHAQVMRLAARASHVPERAVARVNPASSPRASSWPIRQPRPLRLLARPEPIEVMALVPDSPPLQFVWRGTAHRIRHADGPERIAGEWWQDDLPLRDYYRVEDEAGRRFWVYREGLYQPDRRVRWYLHGMFA